MIKLKMNWGIGIAVFYVSFVLLLIGFVIFTSFNKVDLVDENYYEKELDYQSNIDKINRTNNLALPLIIETVDNVVRLTYPKTGLTSDITGMITFFRPSDKKLDFILPVKPDDSWIQYIKNEKLTKGLWRIKVDWAVGDSAYYNEEVLIIN
ncbi:MAG: FixH family protein [Candidatus Kapabacteria bacterium]|nr:FixH family protein [Candidatus Kapabacteria bacterium]